MGENREYITQMQDEGAIHISQDVIVTIAAVAACEVEGVQSLSGGQGSEFSERFGKKSAARGIRMSVSENDEISISCSLVALYGYSVVELAKNVQESVSSAIESMTALRVASVDVNICSISMKK